MMRTREVREEVHEPRSETRERTTVGIPFEKVGVRKWHGQSTQIATLGCSDPVYDSAYTVY